MRRRESNRRAFLGAALAGMGGMSVRANSEDSSKAKITEISPPGVPGVEFAFSPGILAEGRKLLFISGRGPRDYQADPETQIRQTFENLDQVLVAAGATMKNIVILRAYFVNIARDLPAYRKVRREFLVRPYPASTSIGVSALAGANLQVEIEAVAVL